MSFYVGQRNKRFERSPSFEMVYKTLHFKRHGMHKLAGVCPLLYEMETLFQPLACIFSSFNMISTSNCFFCTQDLEHIFNLPAAMSERVCPGKLNCFFFLYV